MPKIEISYDFKDIDMELNEDIDIYISDAIGDKLGFIKIHITNNGKILILTEGQYNNNDNIVFDQWIDDEDYVKKVNQIQNTNEARHYKAEDNNEVNPFGDLLDF